MPSYELNSLEEREVLPGYRARFLHSERTTLVFWDIDAGAVLPEHHHPHEQIANVLEGQFELTIDGVSKVYEPGTVAVIPPDAIHSGKALTNCRILDIFAPVREDYRTS